MGNNLLDLPLLLQVLEALARERAVDLETVDEGGNGDETVGLDVLVELVGSGLVKKDGVLGLVLDCIRNQSVFCRVHRIRSRKASPFPLDHFFFCFFAPDAAGAILDMCSGVLVD